MILEICYTVKLDKDGPKQTSWTYYHTQTEDFAKATKEATKYFKTFTSENGWVRKTQIKHILPIRKHNETASR